MKVLLASSSSGSRGGGEIFLKYLAQGLAKRGHEIIFWCAEHPRMDELAEVMSPLSRVVRSSYRNFYDYKTRIFATSLNHGTSRRLAVEWENLQPDVIHVNKQNLEDGLDMLRAADMLSIPSLCTIHITQTAKYLGSQMAWVRDALARRSLRVFKGPFIAVQETRRRELSGFLRNGNETKTIFNGVPLLSHDGSGRRKREELGVTDDNLLIIGLGRMEAQKRPLHFLELAQRLHSKVPMARFLWIGGGSLIGQWDEWVAAHKMGHVLRRVDWQSDVRPFLFAADFFLHTAAYEGLPIALTEAMSAGLPCAVPQYLVEEVSFFSKDTFLVIEEEATLARVLLDPAERQVRAQRAQNLASERFSIETMAQQYESLYLSLTAGKKLKVEILES